MIGGIVVSHGKLGEELINALSIILGEAPNIEAISIGWYDDVEDSKRKINLSLKRVDQKNGVVIFTDMFGGTPSNLSFTFQKDGQIEIITGVNLPMLIKFVSLQRIEQSQGRRQKSRRAGEKEHPPRERPPRLEIGISGAMIERTITIRNKLGLHARAAVKFVNTANRFSSDVRIEKDGSEIDGKSILGILTLAATQGSDITLDHRRATDEEAAWKALADLINNRFGEKE